MMKLTGIAAALPVLCVVAQGVPPLTEDFGAGTSGWQIADMPCGGSYLNPAGTYSVDWNESGGDPGA